MAEAQRRRGPGGAAMTRTLPPPQIRCNSVAGGIRATARAYVLDIHKLDGRNSPWNWVKRRRRRRVCPLCVCRSLHRIVRCPLIAIFSLALAPLESISFLKRSSPRERDVTLRFFTIVAFNSVRRIVSKPRRERERRFARRFLLKGGGRESTCS